ncbi:hypothetical protein LJR084_001928 [Variovorax sp. LjRoot84]|uniref:LysM peptidoglycan-binding domain-containing protein n=1 Tax=Variovorax sp. LjRoot84 TaxID=3342340 RepID=UPI003ECEF00C
MVDTVLLLGPFEFSNLEVPESLTLGGAQSLAKHKFPGGARNVQALGPDHAPISWGGLMLGETALDRAKGLDFLRIQGNPLSLTFFDSTYTVVIERFEYTVERYYKVGYRITLEVVSDDSQPVQDIPPSGFDTAIQADSDWMMGMAPEIGDSLLTSAISTLDSVVGRVGSFAAAGLSTISGVLGAISAVSSRVTVLTAGVQNTVNSVGVIGGVLPNMPLPAQISTMASQVLATAQYPMLLNIGSVATRMGRNVSAANLQSSTRERQVAGGTLFGIAAEEYGDATRWPAIAQASGIKEMVLSGVQTLKIPANPQDSGGVPGQ